MVNTARRPLLLRVLPTPFRQAAVSRFYRPMPARYRGLLNGAPLHFAPSICMRGVLGDVISDAIAFTGVYDLHCTRWLSQVARDEGGVFVDVGANLGYFSFIWLAQQARNRAIAFEPSPRNLQLLARNVTENRFKDRIAIHAEAVGETKGQLQFDLGPTDQTGWGGFAAAGDLAVDVVRLDDALADIPEIAVLKIDIQGAELWAMRGAEQLLRKRRTRYVWWEENKERMKRLGIESTELQSFIRSVGYEPVVQGDPAADVVDWCARPRVC